MEGTHFADRLLLIHKIQTNISQRFLIVSIWPACLCFSIGLFALHILLWGFQVYAIWSIWPILLAWCISYILLSQETKSTQKSKELDQEIVDMRFLFMEKEKALQKVLADSRLLQKEQEDTAHQLALAVSVADLGLWEVDLVKGGEIINERTLEIYGLDKAEEYTTAILTEMLIPEQRAQARASLERIKQDAEPFVEEYELLSDEGQRFIKRSAFVQMAHGVLPMKLLVIERDISIDRLRELDLLEAKRIAEHSAMVESQFLSSMSHEIRTPLNAVIGLSEILLEENTNPEQASELNVLNFSAQNLLTLVNDILDFNKIVAGQMVFESLNFSLFDLSESVRQSLKVKAKENGTKLTLTTDDNVPLYISGDPTRLTQILLNLASNAVKFTEDGIVTIHISMEGRVENLVRLRFDVKDTGIGIPADKLDHIFERFTQADNSTARKFGGTGLGLSISKQLVELQGGEIEVRSELGKGSCFSALLDFKVSDEREKLEEDQDDFKNFLQGKRVLLAEDTPINVKIACRFLHKVGLEVDVAEDGLEAVAMVQKQDYDLILMDIHMPNMDGYEASQEIRNLPEAKYSTVPIVALTAEVLGDIQDKVVCFGMNDYASKPLRKKILFEKMVRLIRENES